MDENLKDFLTKIGVGSDTIADLAKTDRGEDDKLDVGKHVSTFNDHKKELLRNDSDFISPLKKEIRGKELATAENKLKRVFGLTTEEMDGKNYEEILDFVKGKSASSGGSADLDEIQKQLVEANNRIKTLEDEELPSARSEAETKIREHITGSKIDALVRSHKLTVEARAILPAVRSALSQGYEVSLDENDKLVVKTKDGLAPMNADKTKTFTIDDIIKNQLDDLKVIQQSNGGEGASGEGKKIDTGTGNGSPAFVPQGLAKAQENASQMSNIKPR